jgi:uncharacterized alpha-E superfamily protein
MLSRTADSLYWLARYVERADFLARIMEAAMRMASLPAGDGAAGAEWDSAIAISDQREAFTEAYGAADEQSVRRFLAFDHNNPSSIRTCLNAARNNARTVRTALTSEVWEAVNDAWNQFNALDEKGMDMQAFARFIEWTKNAARAFDGAVHRTQLRNDGYAFLRLGAAVERADNTARILDVKYHMLLPASEPVGGGLDYFQWSTILREVSALTAYRWVYRESIKPWLVADLLILNRQMPRSLASCCADISAQLDQLGQAYGRRGPAQRAATATLGRLTSLRIEQIFQSGLHEFVEAFVDENARLSNTIAEQYLL